MAALNTLTLPPAPPGPNDGANFGTRAFEFLNWWYATHGPELNAWVAAFNNATTDLNSYVTDSGANATAAANSATTASTKAGEAATSASAALASKNAAATSETNAKSYSDGAAISASQAVGAKGSAITSAMQSSNSADTASTHADNASESATSALASKNSAETAASTATTAATTATTKASEAATSAITASTAATTATTKASEAAASSASAAIYAQNAGVMPAMRDTLGVFPGVVRPTLNLHAGLVSNDDCPLGTFSRSSVKWRMGPTGLLESVAAGKVAREWDAAGNLLGWSLEEQRTGRLWPSRDLTNVRWVVDGITPLKNATGSDGVTNSASTITATKDNAVIYQDYIASGSVRAMSVRIKRKTGTGGVYISQDGGSTWTDITSNLSTNAWYRASVIKTVSNPRCLIKLATNGDALSVDFFNIEDGAFLTSDIETVSGAVTRPADVWTIPTSAYPFNSTEGTLYAKFNVNSIQANYPTVFALANGGSYLALYKQGPGSANLHSDFFYQSTSQGWYENGTVVEGKNVNAAISYSNYEYGYAIDGTSYGPKAGGLVDYFPNILVGGGFNNFLNGHISNLAYFPRRLPSSTLQYITA